jgi:acetaldehyde dehydrogenase (acetylating)
MIDAEEHDNEPKVTVVTCGGTRTRPYVIEKGKGVEK